MHKSMTKFACAALMAFAALTNVSKATITFTLDPDGGAGGSGPIAGVALLDWSPDSALSVEGLTAIRNFLAGAGSTTFTTYTHGKLVGALDGNATNLLPNVGVGEITFVAGITETVTGATVLGGSLAASFGFSSTPVNYFEMYWSAAVDSNQLAGTGYNNGTLIMSGVATAFQGDAVYNQSTTVGDLDQFLGDNYPLIDTFSGNGSSSITGVINFINPLFFSGLTAGSTISFFTTQQRNPYNQANPSAAFSESPGGVAPVPDGAGTPLTSIGFLNGNLAGTSPDVQFQTDASTSFDSVSVIPEPMSLLVWGGVIAVGGALYARRRRATA